MDQFQTGAFWASLGTSLGFTILLALLFSIVRPRHTLVYAPKIKYADQRHAPPPMGRGIFAWLHPVLRTKEEVLIDKLGLDAALFLRFTRMLRNMFLALSVLGCLVMIPVNVADGNKSNTAGISVLQMMTPLQVFGNGLWAQVVCAWLIDIIVAYFLWHNYRRVRQLRRAYFQSREYQMSLHARTLMVTDIPSNMRTDEGLMRLTDEVNPTGVLPKATVGRNVKVLPDLIKEHEEAVKKLESVLSKYLKNPDKLPAQRPTIRPPRRYHGAKVEGHVDAIEYLTNRIRELELEIKDIRERVDKRDAMPYGFASWEQIEQAHAVAYAARKKHPQGSEIVLAPRPNDLIWENLALSKGARKTKKIMGFVWVTVLTLIWLPFNAAIAIFLSNLSNLGSVWPAFQRQLETNKTGWSIVQGIASPAITSLVYLVLPIIFRRLSIRAGDTTKTARERHVLNDLYNFFTFNNLIVFSLFSAVWQFITAVIKAKSGTTSVWDAIVAGQFYLKVTIALCSISPFWITYLLQRNLGAAIDIAQLWTVSVVWFERTFMAPTPRQNIEWTTPMPFEYAAYYNYFLFYATIALCFSTLQPIVLPVTALYFSVDAVLKKYLLMYVFITKTESGGQFWRVLYNRMIFAAILSNFFIGFVVKGRGPWSMVFAIAPLPFLMLGFKWYCMRTFDEDMKYYVRSGMHDQERLAVNDKIKRSDRLASKFGHPALYKPLITPMVHAKAQHVLGQVYRGRLNSDTGRSMAFSDIAMEPMDHQGRPQTGDAPFEIVPEAQQDFAFYKNRADFREEGGELYGKPEDLISERSHTPKSFMGPGGKWSPPHSRDSSPSPDHGRLPRKAIGEGIHPAYRSGPATQSPSRDGEPDLGLRGGLYTDPNDEDQLNLLRNAEGMSGAPVLPTPDVGTAGQFLPMDRWRAAGAQYGPVHQEEETGSYDYFRGRR
jgi:hypothetical protein